MFSELAQQLSMKVNFDQAENGLINFLSNICQNYNLPAGLHFFLCEIVMNFVFRSDGWACDGSATIDITFVALKINEKQRKPQG